MVRAGTSITFQVQGSARGAFRPSVSDMRAQVISFLSAYFFVETVEINIRSLVGGILAGEFWNYDYSAIVSVVPRSDYARAIDVGSVVGHAFWTVSGTMPTVSTDFQESLGGVSETGVAAGALGSVVDSITALPNLLVFGIVAIVALIVFSPAGKTLAGNVRI